MTTVVNTEGKGTLSYDITGVASVANAGLGSIANPEGVSIQLLRGTIYFVSESDAAANLSIGITTAAAAATDILNALAVGGVSAAEYYNCWAMQNTAKTQVSAPALWTSALYLTVTGSSTTVGMLARLYLEYVRV